jgi:hypothetical protein
MHSLDGCKTILKVIDGLMNLEDIRGSITKVKDAFENKHKSLSELQNAQIALSEKVSPEHITEKMRKDFLKNFKFDKKVTEEFRSEALMSKQLANCNALIAIITTTLTISKAASFVSFKTAEYKIDNENSIYYVTPVYNVPFTSFEIGGGLRVPPITSELVSEAALDFIDPAIIDEKKDSKIYEYNGKYFVKEGDIEEELLDDIFKYPERFLSSSRIFTDVTLNDGGYKISKELQEFNDARELNKNGAKDFSQAQYEYQIEIERENYANYIFKCNFEPNNDLQFTDGFGERFSNRRDALDSLNLKINDETLLDTKYALRTNHHFVERKTEQELQDYVNENTVIDSKSVRTSSLLNKTTFDELEEINPDLYYSIFYINYYGELRYFRTEAQV